MRTRTLLMVALVGATGCSCGSKQASKDATVAKPSDPGTPVIGATGSAAGTQVAVDSMKPKAPARPEHAVFRFVSNRHAAHRFVDNELVLDGSSVGFHRYTRFGMPKPRWHTKTVAGERAIVADRAASLDIPLTVESVKTTTAIVVRVSAKQKQTLTLKVNGRKAAADAKRDLVDGWQTVTFAVDPDRFVAGDNQLVFETGGKDGNVAFAWLRAGTGKVTDDPRGAAKFDAAKDSLALAKNAAVSWYFTVPEGGHLVAPVTGAGCKVEVKARANDDSFVGGLLGGDTDRVDLSTMAGKVVGFTLTARECAVATLEKPAITLHGPDATPLPKAPPPKYVVLWIMDALRADHMQTFQPGAPAQTPNWDELAKSSAIFRQHYVQGNESKTSHASIWTSLYPAAHHIRMAGEKPEWRLNKNFERIAVSALGAGYFTTGLTGNGNVNDGGGYAKGFKAFRNMMREKHQANGIIYGETIVKDALASFDKHRNDGPVYLYFGTIDTHGPWIARKPWIDIYSPPPYHGPFTDYGTIQDLGIRPDSMGCHKIPPMKDILRLRAIYDSAISYQDRELGKFIAQLKSWGVWDQTMLVVSADHGEEMFEDSRCNHGGSLRDSLTRVPLIVHDPARIPAGTIVDEGVDSVDIFPTILEAMGVEAPASIQGRSLVPLAQGVGKGWAQPSYASMYEFAHTMRVGRWKIRIDRHGNPLINDFGSDPGEMTLVKNAEVERRMLTDNLGMFLALRAQWKRKPWGTVANVSADGAAALDAVETP